MNEKEKALLILKAKFPDNEDVINTIEAMIQLKRMEILLNQEEEATFHKYAYEWYRKGLIIYTGIPKDYVETKEE